MAIRENRRQGREEEEGRWPRAHRTSGIDRLREAARDIRWRHREAQGQHDSGQEEDAG
jgi:hypothetical protein